MGTPRRFDPQHRLEAYFDTLRAPSLKDTLRHTAANWQVYAAVTGSAMAMATGASAAVISGEEMAPEPFASATNAKPLLSARAFAPVNRVAVPNLAPANPAQTPLIATDGVVPIFSKINTIQPGEWVSIYGNNFAPTTSLWNGDFPISLGGVSVTINGKSAYLMYVSPGQINLQAPDDMATGTVSVVVTNAAGSASSTVTLNSVAPSFSLLDMTPDGTGYVAGIILRPDGSGSQGGGTYDFLGPTGNFFGYRTVAAKPGDTVELFGVGFGPTTPAVAAGAAFTGAAPVNNAINLYINNAIVTPSFVGLSSAGLYQINLTVPSGIGGGEVPIQAFAGGIQTQAKVLFSLQNLGGSGAPVSGGGTVGSAGPPFSFGAPSSGGGFGSGGGSGGGGGSGSVHRKRKPYAPRLVFPPK